MPSTQDQSVLDAIQKANGQAKIGGRMILTLPPNAVASMTVPGTYTVQLSVMNWMGQNGTKIFSFSKGALPVPMITIIGGSTGTFQVTKGLAITAAVNRDTVCTGQHKKLNL